jgi:dienelactone hydrolase
MKLNFPVLWQACVLWLTATTLGAGEIPWDMKQLEQAPSYFVDAARSEGNIRAIFYEGLPWKGRSTRVFAYVGLPEMKPGERVPAMVLVHGGGGSAFIPWVRLWTSRGYAAIAMDTCGCISGGGYENHPRHDAGGPPGWGGFDQMDMGLQDQWTYHAVADVILAHSLIRSLKEVDPDRTGLTGISWGGYLTCIVAGVDARFKFAAPVYGCGFLGEDSAWLGTFKDMGPVKSAKWLETWDPSHYLTRARMPVLWVNGTCDFAYPMDSWRKSTRLPRGRSMLCLRVNMPHGHGGPGENPKEILAVAENLFRGEAPMATIVKQTINGGTTVVEYRSKVPVTRAEFNYTTDDGPWQKRTWHTRTVVVNGKEHRVSALIPSDAKAWYFNLMDDRGLVVSSEFRQPGER